MTLSAARLSGTQMFRGSSLCDGGDQLAAVQPLLRPSAVLMAAHRGVTDHVCAYLLIPHHSEPSRGNHIGCWCLDRGAKSKTRPLHHQHHLPRTPSSIRKKKGTLINGAVKHLGSLKGQSVCLSNV